MKNNGVTGHFCDSHTVLILTVDVAETCLSFYTMHLRTRTLQSIAMGNTSEIILQNAGFPLDLTFIFKF